MYPRMDAASAPAAAASCRRVSLSSARTVSLPKRIMKYLARPLSFMSGRSSPVNTATPRGAQVSRCVMSLFRRPLLAPLPKDRLRVCAISSMRRRACMLPTG